MDPHFTLPRVTLCKCCVMCGCWCGQLAVTVTSVAPPPLDYSELHSALRDEQIRSQQPTAPLTRLRTLQIHRERVYLILFRVAEHF